MLGRRARWALLLALVPGPALVRCAEEFQFESVLGQDIRLDAADGLPLLYVAAGELPPAPASVDLGAALTAVDAGAELSATPVVDVTVAEDRDPGAARDLVERLILPELPIRNRPLFAVGVGDGTAVGAVLGADVLARFAVELALGAGEPGAPSLVLLDSLPGSDDDLAGDCQAVVRFTLRGGGRESASGCAGPFEFRDPLPPRRVVLPACLGGDDAAGAGRDAALALSTAVAPLVLAESSYRRVRPGASPDELAEAALRLAGVAEPVPARLSADGTHLAFAALVSDEDDPGPCRERAGAAAGARRAAVAEVRDVPVAVVPDATLAALRDEIGAGEAVLDGLIGTAALAAFARVRVDYPAARITFECAADDPACAVRTRPPLAGRACPREPAGAAAP